MTTQAGNSEEDEVLYDCEEPGKELLIVDDDSSFMLFKRVLTFMRPLGSLREANCLSCYIPRYKILILQQDETTIKAYNTNSFKCIATKKFQRPLTVVSYCESYNKLFFGGQDYYLEVSNPRTLKTETMSKLRQNKEVTHIRYLQKYQNIAVGIWGAIHILTKDLNLLYEIKLEFKEAFILDLSTLKEDFLLITYADLDEQRKIQLYDLEKRKMQEYNGIKLSWNGSVQVIEPTSRVTCSANSLNGISPTDVKKQLIQLAWDYQAQNLYVHRQSDHISLWNLKEINNSEYFIAQRFTRFSTFYFYFDCLLKFNEDRAEFMEILEDKPDFTMPLLSIKEAKTQLVIGMDEKQNFCLYKLMKMKKSQTPPN